MNNENFFEELDYEEIHRKLNVRKKDCLDWLKKALETEVKTNQSNPHQLSMEYAKLLRSRNLNLAIAKKYTEEELYDIKIMEAIKTSSTFLEAVYKVNQIEYKEEELIKIDNLAKYFEMIRSKDYYTVVLSCKDTCSKYWESFLIETKLPVGITPAYRSSFAFVINNNDVLYEESSKKTITHHCTSIKNVQPLEMVYEEKNACYIVKNVYLQSYIKILSTGYNELDQTSRSEILVNNIDFSMNKRGINVIVIDNRYGKVVDSFNVDTYADSSLKMIRK